MTSLNTIWIGPPTEEERTAIPGHAELGAKKMATALATEGKILHYWCLRKHADAFRRIFSSYENIHVCPIEDEIEAALSCAESPDWLMHCSRFMQEFLATLLDTTRNRIKDRVIVKDGFCFYLLLVRGGYVFDTNIQPLAETKLTFPRSEFMRVPFFVNKPLRKSFSTTSYYDCWLLYANEQSPHSFDRAYRVFERFMARYRESEMIFARDGYSRAYFLYSTSMFSLLLIDDAYNPLRQSDLEFIMAHKSSCDSYVDIRSMGLRKYYFNTHKYEAHFGIDFAPQLFVAAHHKLHGNLTDLLEAGADPKQTIAQEPFFIVFPLVYAISAGDPIGIRLLLQFGASLDQIFDGVDKGGKRVRYTAREFAKHLNNPEVLSCIADAEASYDPRLFSSAATATSTTTTAAAAADSTLRM
jgi:hypothetical protein